MERADAVSPACTVADKGILIVVSGLPGTGKTTLASALSTSLCYTHLSVDVVEAAMWRSGVGSAAGSGLAAYEVVAAVAEVQLSAGRGVVVDAVNAVSEARAMWPRAAAASGASVLFVECVLNDLSLHRHRVEKRPPLPGFYVPSWEDVERRRAEYVEWPVSVPRLDTSRPVDELVREVLGRLSGWLRDA